MLTYQVSGDERHAGPLHEVDRGLEPLLLVLQRLPSDVKAQIKDTYNSNTDIHSVTPIILISTNSWLYV